MSFFDKLPSHVEVIERPPSLPSRPAESHKGMFGHALLVGGSLGMTGAILLAGHAALRGGAGLVTLAVPAPMQVPVATAIPCAMTIGLPCDASGRFSHESLDLVKQRMQSGTVLGIGPGLGRSPDSDSMVERLFQTWEWPSVYDADALNALADGTVWRNEYQHGFAPFPRGCVLTPHPGEWSRLSRIPSTDPDAQRMAAVAAAARLGSVIVLKGHQTLVTDRQRVYGNTTGNPSLAVGGSGDSLTGLITALLCQKMPPFDAAVLGVYLHGLAGDLAQRALGTPSILPTDWLLHLPAAFQSLSG